MSNKDNVSTGNAGEYFVVGELEGYHVLYSPCIHDKIKAVKCKPIYGLPLLTAK